MKILILGGHGMLGHRLWINLRRQHETWVTVRQTSSPFPDRPEFPVKYVRPDVDASNFDQVTRALASIQVRTSRPNPRPWDCGQTPRVFQIRAQQPGMAQADNPGRGPLRDIKKDGNLKAAYFNPLSIKVFKAEWQRKQEIITVFVELRDVNYPGSKFNLQYDPKTDRLKGAYFQAVHGETYDIEFVREQ